MSYSCTTDGCKLESKSAYHRCICLSMFIAVLFTVATIWNQPRRPSQTSKENVVYTQQNFTQLLKNEIYHL